MPGIGSVLRPDQPLVALVHHPLALETGLSAQRARELRGSERAALSAAHRVVVTSRTTAHTLVADYGVAAARIHVAVPGTDPAPPARPRAGGPVELLSVGTLVPRKGHDRLLSALTALRGFDWRLTIVGDDSRDQATAQALRQQVRQAGLVERVVFTGAVPSARLQDLFLGAEAFVLASRHEGFGMAFAEALAHGLPVIGVEAGAVREAVPEGAGVLVAPDDPGALEQALRRLLAEPAWRASLAASAREAASRLRRWPESAALLAQALREARDDVLAHRS